ncbi:MAG: DUF5519 family protein [Proteobacteria bacterium]|nr:DUF5519 family protein [Pseudomonadota bacterium]
MIVCFAIVLVLNFSQSAHAERSRLESDYLITPRVDVDGIEAFALIFRIEFNGEYLFVLEHASDPEQNTTSSGRYDSDSQTLVVDENELETGELYSATLEFVSQSPDTVFRLKSAALLFSPSGQSEPTTDDVPLPIRSGVRPRTTSDVPHVQIGVEPVSAVNTELFRRVYMLPGVEQRTASVSFRPGTWGLWLGDNLTIAQPQVRISGREFAHIHPDGSLHLSLEPNRAIEAVQARWAIFHPWADQEGREGFVMLYTPRSMEDLDVIFQLIVDSYNFIAGQNVQATDYY